MSPITIMVMLHHYAYPFPYPNPSPASEEVTNMLIKNGLLERDEEDAHEATDKGRAWVEMICSTPFPVTQYADPRFIAKKEDMR